MNFEVLRSPVQFQQQVGISADLYWLREYEAWFEREGHGISDAVDRAGTPWLRMFDRWGARVMNNCLPTRILANAETWIPDRCALASF